MLKPYCEPAELCIRECRLDEKRGGKSQYKRQLPAPVAAAVLVLSDTVAVGRKPDTAGRAVESELRAAGFTPIHYAELPRSEEHTSEIPALMSQSYDVFC